MYEDSWSYNFDMLSRIKDKASEELIELREQRNNEYNPNRIKELDIKIYNTELKILDTSLNIVNTLLNRFRKSDSHSTLLKSPETWKETELDYSKLSEDRKRILDEIEKQKKIMKDNDIPIKEKIYVERLDIQKISDRMRNILKKESFENIEQLPEFKYEQDALKRLEKISTEYNNETDPTKRKQLEVEYENCALTYLCAQRDTNIVLLDDAQIRCSRLLSQTPKSQTSMGMSNIALVQAQNDKFRLYNRQKYLEKEIQEKREYMEHNGIPIKEVLEKYSIKNLSTFEIIIIVCIAVAILIILPLYIIYTIRKQHYNNSSYITKHNIN